jgi:hypothetical protein
LAKLTFEVVIIPKLEGISIENLYDSVFSNDSFSYEGDELSFRTSDINKSIIFNIDAKVDDGILFAWVDAITDVRYQHMKYYDEFKYELKKHCSKNDYEITFLNKPLSAYYSGKLYPIINEMENNLRKLLVLTFSLDHGKGWENHFLDKTKIKKLKSNQKSAKSEHIFDEMTISDLEKFIFIKLFVGLKNQTKNVSDIILLEESAVLGILQRISNGEILEEYTSVWERYFKPIIADEFKVVNVEAFILEFNKIRNKVAHNKSVSFEEYEFIKKESKQFINMLYSLCDTVIYNKFGAKIFEAASLERSQEYVESIRIASERMGEIIAAIKLPSFSWLSEYTDKISKMMAPSVAVINAMSETLRPLQDILDYNRTQVESITSVMKFPNLEFDSVTPISFDEESEE